MGDGGEEEASAETTAVAVRRLIEFKWLECVLRWDGVFVPAKVRHCGRWRGTGDGGWGSGGGAPEM